MSTALTRGVESVSMTSQSRYVIKRPFWSFLERTFRVYTPDGQLMMMVRHPILRLREEFTVWADESRQRPLLQVKAREVIAINFSFDVADADSGQLLGTIQKRGLRSLIRDTFLILDPGGTQVGTMEEEGASMLRRVFPWLTSRHGIYIGGQQVAAVQQIFRFFTKEFAVELRPSSVDPRFVLACALLALMAEARREDSK
jgi:uncharacterized protein YxjI